jgi:hypothetical protein
LAGGFCLQVLEIVLERIVRDIDRPQDIEDSPGLCDLAIEQSLGGGMVHGLQLICIPCAYGGMAEGDRGDELEDTLKILFRKALPRGEEEGRHLPRLIEPELAHIWPALGILYPILVILVAESSIELRAILEGVDEGEYFGRRLYPIPNDLEESLASDSRLLAEEVITQEFREALLPDRSDQGLPSALQSLEVGLNPYSREYVILDEVGGGKLEAPGVEGLEDRIGIELVVDIDLDEKQLPRHRFAEEGGQILSVARFGSFSQSGGKPLAAFPEKAVGLRQAARVYRGTQLDEVILIESVVAIVQEKLGALDQ